MLHLGPVASGTRRVVSDQHLRQSLSHSNHIRCYDPELDAVIESVCGNRKERYVLVRGATDYGNGVAAATAGAADGGDDVEEGRGGKEWQLYSSLMAAAVMRALVEDMPARA